MPVDSDSNLKQEFIDTDVLIIGAGAGGMMAAISAADSGASVILCEKGNARRSGGIMGGNDHFMCYIPGIHNPVVRNNYIRTLSDRGMVDEDIASKIVDLSYDVVQKWESWGINMKTDEHYEFTGHAWPGSSGKMGEPGNTDRYALHFSDDRSCVKLEKQVKEKGIRIINRVMVNELLKDTNGRVVGAIGISTREPKLYVFRSKCIVINKGGVDWNRLYASPNVIGYSMAQPGTGDGVMMAYRIGADLQNAELSGRQVSLRFGPTGGKGTWIGVTRDSEGKPIAPPYLSQPDAELGDPAIENSDAIDLAWKTGRGPVWIDPRGISEEDERYMKWGFESEGMHPFLRWLDRENIDVKKTRFEFITMQPGSNIQARIDANFCTSIEGLYFVPPGNLPVSAVGGLVAGTEAAKNIHDKGRSDLGEFGKKIMQFKQRCDDILKRKGTQFANWREAQWAILQTMSCYVLPPDKTESTLNTGYNQLLRLRERAQRILKADNQHDLYHCLEVLNLIDVAELVILSAKERKESRGQARRFDYPFTDPMLNQFLVITMKNGGPTFRWEKPRHLST